MPVRGDAALQIVNTQYAVFFGVIFSLSFYVNEELGPGLALAVPMERLWLLSLLVAYYLMDWFTANVLRHQLGLGFVELFFYVTSVLLLGVVILFMNSEGSLRFLLLGVYSVGVAFYDYSVYRRLVRAPGALAVDSGALPLWSLVFALIRFVLGAVLLFLSMIALWRADIAEDFEGTAISIVIMIVVFRFVRLIYHAHRSLQFEAQEEGVAG